MPQRRTKGRRRAKHSNISSRLAGSSNLVSANYFPKRRVRAGKVARHATAEVANGADDPGVAKLSYVHRRDRATNDLFSQQSMA